MLEVQVVSPERILYSGQASMVICRTTGGGDIAFLTGHAPFIGDLAIWPVEVVPVEGARVRVAVHGGFVEVSNDRVTVLSDVAELADQIDVPRAQRAKEKAESALRSDPDDDEAKAALARAEVRIQVATGTPAQATASAH
jgi:F-type H+-transporting ATPase subunit epsilon